MTTAEIKKHHNNFTGLRDKCRRNTATLMEREEYFHLLEKLPVDLMDEDEWRAEWDSRAGMVLSEEEQAQCQRILAKLMSRIGEEMEVTRKEIRTQEAAQGRSAFKSARLVVLGILLFGVSGIGFYDRVPGIPGYGAASATTSAACCDEGVTAAVRRKEDTWLARADVQQRLDLPDGSTVVLNTGSELMLRGNGDTGGREVTVDGEAFFDLHNQGSEPYVVKTGNIVTTVLGTAFNIKTVGDEVEVTVLRGQVQVSDGERLYGEVTANHRMVVNSVTREHRQDVIGKREEMFWEKEILILGETSFSEAMRRISRRYHVEINVVNASLDDCIIHIGILPSENMRSILDVVSRTVNARVVRRGGRIDILGGSCR